MVELRRGNDRGYADHGWLKSFHTFSFAGYYDPRHMGFGPLRVINEDRVAPGQGFGTHPHRDMEIVTWVLSGELEHRDSEGNHGIILPGHAQRMSAGTGIRHSEHNASSSEDVHFLQMWVLPDTQGIRPGYEQLDISAELASGSLVPIASGKQHAGAVTIHQRDAVLWGTRLDARGSVDIPDDRHVHVFVARGSGTLDPGGRLETGDAARLTEAPGLSFTAGDAGAEVLIWATA